MTRKDLSAVLDRAIAAREEEKSRFSNQLRCPPISDFGSGGDNSDLDWLRKALCLSQRRKQKIKFETVKEAMRKLWGDAGPPQSMSEKAQIKAVLDEVKKVDQTFECGRTLYLDVRRLLYQR